MASVPPAGLAQLEQLIRTKTVFDGRNQYDASRLNEFGLTVYGMGTGASVAAS